MSRRKSRPHDEPTIGSDSFLDVIANIVGILVILIVLIGLRIKNAPHVEQETAASTNAKKAMEAAMQEWQKKADAIRRANGQRRLQYETAQAAREQELVRRKSLNQQIEARKLDHGKQLAQRQLEISRLADARNKDQAEAELIEKNVADLLVEIDSLKQKLYAARSENEIVHSALVEANQVLTSLAREKLEREQSLIDQSATAQSLLDEVERLRQELAAIQPKAAAISEWVHFATPISRNRESKEVHVRVAADRVAYVPMYELVERVRNKVLSDSGEGRSITTGQVGPYEGFRLRYVVRRTEGSLLERVNTMVSHRMQLAGFELIPDTHRIGETEQEAFAGESKFSRLVLSRPPSENPMTLWVYPDAFEFAKRLQTYLHERGYQVAIRPLPIGVPIAGGPQGTASRFQ